MKGAGSLTLCKPFNESCPIISLNAKILIPAREKMGSLIEHEIPKWIILKLLEKIFMQGA